MAPKWQNRGCATAGTPMIELIAGLLTGGSVLPHGYCFLWSPGLVWAHVTSDLVIAASYYSIPFALWQLVRKRPDLPFGWVFALFGVFVMACGTTHLFAAWNVWHADYWPEAGVKAVTAVTSLGTAILLWPLIPRALAIPSQSQLAEAIRKLEMEVERREQVERELRQANLQLQQKTAKLDVSARDLVRSNAELEQFAYATSHDLQEPLRMVVGYTQLLQRRLADKLDGESREFMAYAVDGATRMQQLIQDILAYSRVGTRAEPSEPVESAEVVRDVLGRLATAIAESGADIELGTLPGVFADRTQLAQLFQNLIGNAIKFRRKDAPAKVRVEARREGSAWRFEVADNGIGIDPEYRRRLFVIFQRLHTRREYPGTGIGLAICKRIVERHGGEIGIGTAPGGGSVFWFTLPEEKSP